MQKVLTGSCLSILLVAVCLHPRAASSNRVSAEGQEQLASAVSIQLQPILTTGLTSPVFAGNAHDNSNRLFIVEQGGRIKVLQPGSSSPTIFLDISTKLVSGGEQGLLGLAFHPQFSSNHRFFVDYTRQPDGATVIAEYHASAGNPNVADTAETVLLTIPQPFANHNGGMLAFGFDGFLYIGMGDGGSGNDPGNRAQNIDELLGKILRIDVNTPNGVTPYSSPSTNPFFGATPGRDEIYAVGMRNPWRFSFDRQTGALMVGDVGQGAWEEIDIVTNGGNYGWRVFEGMHCTNLDPTLCAGTGYTPPITEYGHTAGRCSVTGGYVYRGSQSALPFGSYVFADFCTGEIFLLDGGVQSVLLDTALNISSFGEDEAGEIYVVGLGGQLYKVTGTTTPTCTFSLAPTSQSFPAAGGSSSVSVTTQQGCSWSAVSNAPWITITSGTSGTGSGTVMYSVASNKKGTGPRSSSITIAGQTFSVAQAGPTGSCTYSLVPSSGHFGVAGGPSSFRISTTSTCSWLAVTSDSWITISSGTGTGIGTVSFSVAQNSGAGSRQGSINVQGQLFTVTQDGGGCSFSLNASSASFGAGGGTGSVNVTALAGCGWMATSNASFITVTSGASGSGNGTVGYSVSANPQTTPRSGTMTIAGLTFTVNQAASTPTCVFGLSPISASFGSGGGAGSVNVTTGSGCSWGAVSNAPWITVTSGGSGSGSGTVNFSVAANPTTASRMSSLTVAGLTFSVTQAGASGSCSFSISPTQQTFGSKGGTGSVAVTASSGCSWSASSNAPWLIITSTPKGTGNGTVAYSVATNTTGAPRSGTLTIAGLTFTVKQ